MIEVNVQKGLCGAEPFLVRVPPQATLALLRSVLSGTEDATNGCAPTSSSLVIGGHFLRDEFNIEKSRWKILTEYGIEDGATIGWFKHVPPVRNSGLINIALMLVDDDGAFLDAGALPIEVDVTATLDELKALIRERERLALDEWVLTVRLGGDALADATADAGPRGKSLADHGIEEGMTLGLKIERAPCLFKDISNSPIRRHIQSLGSDSPVSFRCESPQTPTAIGGSWKPGETPSHIECRAGGNPCGAKDAVACTPEKVRPVEPVATPCKTTRSKAAEVRAKKALRRL